MAKTVTITKFSNGIEESERQRYLQVIEKNSDTDVLKILARAACKIGANDKVRKFKHFL